MTSKHRLKSRWSSPTPVVRYRVLKKRRMVPMWKWPICENSIWNQIGKYAVGPCWPNDFRRLNSRYRYDAERFAHHLDWKNAYIAWQRKVPWTVGTVRLRKQPISAGKNLTTRLMELWGHIVSHREVSLEDTIQAHHPRSHITMRSSAEKAPLSSGGPAPWRRTWAPQTYPTWFDSDNRNPGGLDAISAPGHCLIQALAATDRVGTWSLCPQRSIKWWLLPQFVTWYEKHMALSGGPCRSENRFWNFGLSNFFRPKICQQLKMN